MCVNSNPNTEESEKFLGTSAACLACGAISPTGNGSCN